MPTTASEIGPRTELIRKLGSSKFNYWFGYVANLSLVIWLVSHAFTRGHARLGAAALLACAAAGPRAWARASRPRARKRARPRD